MMFEQAENSREMVFLYGFAQKPQASIILNPECAQNDNGIVQVKLQCENSPLVREVLENIPTISKQTRTNVKGTKKFYRIAIPKRGKKVLIKKRVVQSAK